MRSSARSGRTVSSPRTRRTTELALFGVEGGLRSSRAGLAPHLWPAGDPIELLEQLRSVPFSREADPARDPERARGQAAAGLRQGRECARLALR